MGETPFITPLEMWRVEPNKGQLKGLPENPRHIIREKYELLKSNISNYPELLAYRALLVFPMGNGRFIIIGGNMRYRAMAELGYTTAPCLILPEDTDIERLKAYAIIDNNPYGEWDMDLLANQWDAADLLQWGMDLNFELEDLGDDKEGGIPSESFAKLVFDKPDELESFRQGFEDLLKNTYSVRITYSDNT